MSPEQKSHFSQQAAKARNALLGIIVKFRQQDFRACVSAVSVSFDLDSGGLRQSGEFTVRFLASDLRQPPRRGESIAFHGRSYFITQVGEAINNPSEITCTVHPGNAQ